MATDEVRDTRGIEGQFPIGSRVRPTPRMLEDYPQFTGHMEMTGTVIGYDGNNVHVQWPEEFTDGHHRTIDDYPGVECPGHCWYCTREKIMIVDTVTTDSPIASTLPTEIPRLRVTITRVHRTDIYGSPYIWTLVIANGPTPTKFEVKECMDKAVSRRMGTRIWNNYQLNDIVNRGIEAYGIDPQVFIDAITQAALAKQAREAAGVFQRAAYDSELQQAIGSQPAIIAIGDQLFTLQPRGSVKASRAMAIIRERITKAAKEQAVKIKAAATAEARTLVRNGERELEEARQQIAVEREAVKNILAIPDWISNNYLPVRRNDSGTFKMAVGMWISTEIKKWQMLHYVATGATDRYSDPIRKCETVIWENKPRVRGVSEAVEIIPRLAFYREILVWVPFDHTTGKYHYKGTAVDLSCYALPHINHRGCLDLQGLPATMNNITDYNRVKNGLTRGNQEVNLMSLLSSFNEWHPDVQNQCPKGLKWIIDNNLVGRVDIPEDKLVGAIRVDVRQEARETFDVDSLREARRARGEELAEINLEHVSEGVEEVEVEEEVEE